MKIRVMSISHDGAAYETVPQYYGEHKLQSCPTDPLIEFESEADAQKFIDEKMAKLEADGGSDRGDHWKVKRSW